MMAFQDIPDIRISKNGQEPDIRLLVRRGYGWMRPDGGLVICSAYDHLNALLEGNQPVPDGIGLWLRAIAMLEEQSRDDHQSFVENIPEDEHPGWHNYSSDAGDAVSVQKSKLVGVLHQAGWIRLGIMKHKGRHGTLEAEGCTSVLQLRKPDLERITDIAELGKLLLTPLRQMTEPQTVFLSHDEIRECSPEFYEVAMRAFRGSKSFRSGTKENAVKFPCRLQMEIDSFEPEKAHLRLPALIQCSVSAEALRWHFPGYAVTKNHGNRSEYSLALPSSVLSAAFEEYPLQVPSVDELQELLEKCGCSERLTDIQSSVPH